MFKRTAFLLYGVFAYALFQVIFLYLIGFTGNILVPKSIDGALEVPLWQALLTNVALIVLFGVQHSVMARTWFKKWWTQYVPEPIERSTYVLFTVIALGILFAFWQPMGGIVWSIKDGFLSGFLMALFGLGWVLVLVSSFLINHFDLFGLRQVWLHFRGQPYQPLHFRVHTLYKLVRHPLYLGLLIGFWATPLMTITHLVLAVGFTLYVLRAIRWEEKDMITTFGDKYRHYRKQVPMILPALFGKRQKSQPILETVIEKK